MCGIAVYYNKRGISRKELNENLIALKTIKHRGPDGEGVLLVNTETGSCQMLKTDETPNGIKTDISGGNYIENSAHLLIGHRRLSIIDTSINGHQPMSFKERYWISFNGEIYNYIEVKKELTEAGYSFNTGSDTEVILAAYDKWKSNAISKFNGMFSIIIYDIKDKNLFVVNDRYGVKPLYYYHSTDKLILFSEVKQIKNYSISKSVNSNVIREFLTTGNLDYDQQTVYNEIKRFKPAHFANISLTNELKKIEFEPYYQLKLTKQKIKDSDALEQFNMLFKNAVSLRLRSDVPLGCSLSGGLDSSSILAEAIGNLKSKGVQSKINTFSVIFPGLNGDESKFIDMMVKQFDVNPFYTNALEEFSVSDFEKHVYHQDFPVQTTSYYAEWSLARKVRRENVTVLLNGQGGDELLAGYHHHFYRYGRQLILSGKITKYLALVKQFAELKEMHPNKLHNIILNDIKLVAKFKLGLADLGSSLANKWAKAGTLIEILKLDFTEYMLPTYLRSDDRDFMAFHIETRHPFLDFNLVDFCYSLPDDMKIRDGWQKWLLRKSADKLPEEIKYRKDKKGYTTPQEVWLEKYRSEFSEYLNFIPAEFKKVKSSDSFLPYSLGAWFKTNGLN